MKRLDCSGHKAQQIHSAYVNADLKCRQLQGENENLAQKVAALLRANDCSDLRNLVTQRNIRCSRSTSRVGTGRNLNLKKNRPASASYEAEVLRERKRLADKLDGSDLTLAVREELIKELVEMKALLSVCFIYHVIILK